MLRPLTLVGGLEQLSHSSSVPAIGSTVGLPEMVKKGVTWCNELRLGLLPFIAVQMTWAEFVVRVQCIQGNPSPPLCLDFISPLKGFVGLSVLPGERVIGALGWWGKVKVSWDGTLDSGKARKTMGEGCNGLAGRWLWYQVVDKVFYKICLGGRD
ncbi:hypothetical protein Tco_0276583 [Tanacetum coccineum]